MRKGFGVLSAIVWLTQFGISVVGPVVLCVWGAVWLRNRFDLGAWIVIVGVLLGLGGAATSLWSSLKAMDRQAKSDDKDSGVGFNDHK